MTELCGDVVTSRGQGPDLGARMPQKVAGLGPVGVRVGPGRR